MTPELVAMAPQEERQRVSEELDRLHRAKRMCSELGQKQRREGNIAAANQFFQQADIYKRQAEAVSREASYRISHRM